MADQQNSPLQEWLKRAKQAKAETPAKAEIEPLAAGEPAVLSHGQERLWLLEKLYPDSSLYNYAQHYTIDGSIDRDALIASFQHVAQRHEVLRSNYVSQNGSVTQIVGQDELLVERIDLTGLSEAEQQASIEADIKRLSRHAHNLEDESLCTLFVFECSAHRTELLLVLHHIAGDAWSLGVMNREVSAHYQAMVAKTDATAAPLRIQYRDVAAWQRKQVVKNADLDYWRNQLSGELSLLNLPFSRQSVAVPFAGRTLHRSLPVALAQRLKQLAQTNGITPFALLLAAYKVLLSKYTGQLDVCVGTPFSNRDTPELEKLVGFFNETVVLRSRLQPGQSFLDTAKGVSSLTLEAMAHKNVPFDTLVNELKPERQAGENPLFQTMFLYNAPAPKLELGTGIAVAERMVDVGASKFDLTLFANETADGLNLEWEYLAAFDATAIATMADRFEALLAQLVAAPQTPVSALSLLTAEARTTITETWNDTAQPLPDYPSIHAWIEQHARTTPDATAVVCNGESLTYAGLDAHATALAVELQNSGLDSNEFVGLYTPRSLEMVIGILAILKAGGAYLPLDPDYPADRLEFMLNDAGANRVLVHPDFAEAAAIQSKQILQINQHKALKALNFKQKNNLSDNAYIIYTSGSTGQPKGVPVSHANLLHSTAARTHFYADRVSSFLLLSSFSFDSSIVGIFWSLCSGGKLVLPAPRLEQDVSALSTLIASEGVSHTLMLPSLYQTLLALAEPTQLASMKAVMVAGEACTASLRNQHFETLPQTRLYNEYGPTEASVWCVAHELTATETDAIVPIGRPIANASAYILDAQLQPVPAGIPGELFIGGKGVTGGYLNRPELTAERFIANPFRTGEQLYRTGDLASFRPNGVIDFLGRTDHQIKIRGHRVELEEIKAALQRHADVSAAEVQAQQPRPQEPGRHGNALRLVAWIQTSNENAATEIRTQLATALPDYMIPASILTLERFPLLPNGKVDTKALPAHEMATQAFEVPVTELQKQLVAIWQEVLGIEQIGLHDNFFDLGGDSLLSIRVVAKAKAADIAIRPTHLLENQTIGELAKAIESASDEATWSGLVAMKTTGSQPPLFCLHSGGAHVLFYHAFARHLAVDRPVYAIQPSGIDGEEEYHGSIETMATDYINEMRKVQPKGPYHLVGTCFGNAVGIEMAHQLKQQGESLAVFYVVDSAPAYLVPPSPNGERKTMTRALDMVREGNWNGIRKKFRNRFIRLDRKLNAHKRDQQQIDLDEMIDSLNDLYGKYTWRPIGDKIVLIRSSEFAQRKDKVFHLDRWNHLAQSGLEVHEVNGHHISLFDEPEVQGLAKVIGAHLESLEVQPA